MARSIVENNESVVLQSENIEKYLGPRRFTEDYVEHDNQIGITNGLRVDCIWR